jgi:hypothetical protein
MFHITKVKGKEITERQKLLVEVQAESDQEKFEIEGETRKLQEQM